MFVASGLTPLQALQSATLTGPRFFGLERRYGSVEAGKVADLLVLSGNPLEDIAATRSVEGVVVRGHYLDRRELDALLEGARRSTHRHRRQPRRRWRRGSVD